MSASPHHSFLADYRIALPAGLLIGIPGWLGLTALSYISLRQDVRARRRQCPVRFHRQRREVCFIDSHSGKAVIVPWESVTAWVATSSGATEYGAMTHHNLGIAVEDPETGDLYTLAIGGPTAAIAAGLWEAIRQYMEHGPTALAGLRRSETAATPDPRELLPYDGVHTFELRRERLHREYRDGERGPVFVFFWYVWHLVTLWKVPFMISEWEYRQGRAPLPQAMRAWSQPLPREQWAEPSALLLCVRKHLAELERRNPRGDFAAHYRQARAAAEQELSARPERSATEG
ncbi:DUF6708 domain-containing protein [Alkalilimnicola ehrlichii]|uniref:DUF6708 domain-containing protein n=1 Tax=Alkalilimnicola ehrlichii TaxID=351052 RepID=UPI0011C0611D|nr:DUF6708 domain-containing protein [Alkalilimnicola ehrlichii]